MNTILKVCERGDAVARGPLDEFLILDYADCSEGRRTTGWVPEEGLGVDGFAARHRPGVHHFAAPHAGRDRHARRHPLAEADQVRDDAVVLAGEPAAGAAEAREDLIDDQQPALGVAQRAQLCEEAIGWDALAAPSLDGFDDHGAHRLAAVACGTPHVARIAEARERGRVRKPNIEGLAEVAACRCVECAEAETVVPALERHDARVSRSEARRLDRGLDCVGARRRQHGARRPATRKSPHERLEELHLDGRRVDVAHAVQQTLGLCGHCGDDTRVPVPGVRHAEGGGEVDVAVAVDIPDICALGALPEDRRDRLEAGHVPALDCGKAFRELDRAGSGNARQKCGRE